MPSRTAYHGHITFADDVTSGVLTTLRRVLRELTPRMLSRYTRIDYDRELALVATVQNISRELDPEQVRALKKAALRASWNLGFKGEF